MCQSHPYGTRQWIYCSSCAKAIRTELYIGRTMQAQVALTTKSCYRQIRNIGHILPSITGDACKTLVQALVTSSLDYANSLQCGLPHKLKRLQRVQHCKIVSRTTKIPHHFRADAIFMTNLLFSSLLWALSFSD